MKRAIACLVAAAAITLTLMPGSAAADPPTGCPAGEGLLHALEHSHNPAHIFDLVHMICSR